MQFLEAVAWASFATMLVIWLTLDEWSALL